MFGINTEQLYWGIEQHIPLNVYKGCWAVKENLLTVAHILYAICELLYSFSSGIKQISALMTNEVVKLYILPFQPVIPE